MKFTAPRTLLIGGVIALAAFAAQTNTPPAPDVTPTQAAQLLTKPRVVLLDVRTPEEFAAGHLAAARNLDFRAADFAQQTTRLDTAQTYVLYCASGNRSSKSAAVLRQQGFRHVVNAGAYKDLKGSIK